MEERLSRFVAKAKSLSADGTASEYNTIKAWTSTAKLELGLTTEVGALTENTKKNRYKDILPYDQSRVALTLQTSDSDSDYINASFIQGAAETRCYIATQGPLPATLVDFWRMIWQYDVKVIIMACREFEMGKRKCEGYWVTEAQTSCFGPFIVSNIEESFPTDETVVRSLSVRYQHETRTVFQFQYVAWPDHDVPHAAHGVLGMLDMARNTQGDSTSPVLIHCSAGAGRTGVICALDYVHDLLVSRRIDDDFSIMRIVMDLRRQRPSAVQTKVQYQFVFTAVGLMFERALLAPVNHHHIGTKPQVETVRSGPVRHPEVRPTSTTSPARPTSTTRHPETSPIIPARTTNRSVSLPPVAAPDHASRRQGNMDATYAVVNKPRQAHRPPAAATLPPSSSPHHYDNDVVGGAAGAQATPLYSTVKPKSRTVDPARSATPVYDTASPANHRLALLSDDLSGRESASAPENSVSVEDDYEYVSAPMKEPSSLTTPGNMGFNCRIKKPHGPRDPPAEWARLER